MNSTRKRQAKFLGHGIRWQKLEHPVTTEKMDGKGNRGTQREKMLDGLVTWMNDTPINMLDSVWNRCSWKSLIANAIEHGTEWYWWNHEYTENGHEANLHHSGKAEAPRRKPTLLRITDSITWGMCIYFCGFGLLFLPNHRLINIVLAKLLLLHANVCDTGYHMAEKRNCNSQVSSVLILQSTG